MFSDFGCSSPQTELNARSVTLTDQIGDFIRLTVVPDRRKLGKRLGKSMSAAYKLLCALSHSKVAELKASGKITISVEGQDHVINLDESRSSKSSRATCPSLWPRAMGTLS